jgi:hypothetical protein
MQDLAVEWFVADVAEPHVDESGDIDWAAWGLDICRRAVANWTRITPFLNVSRQ